MTPGRECWPAAPVGQSTDAVDPNWPSPVPQSKAKLKPAAASAALASVGLVRAIRNVLPSSTWPGASNAAVGGTLSATRLKVTVELRPVWAGARTVTGPPSAGPSAMGVSHDQVPD